MLFCHFLNLFWKFKNDFIIVTFHFRMIALETSRKEDDTKWLTYWVTFAAFSLLEFFSELILDFVPFYWLVKVSRIFFFLISCMQACLYWLKCFDKKIKIKQVDLCKGSLCSLIFFAVSKKLKLLKIKDLKKKKNLQMTLIKPNISFISLIIIIDWR